MYTINVFFNAGIEPQSVRFIPPESGSRSYKMEEKTQKKCKEIGNNSIFILGIFFLNLFKLDLDSDNPQPVLRSRSIFDRLRVFFFGRLRLRLLL